VRVARQSLIAAKLPRRRQCIDRECLGEFLLELLCGEFQEVDVQGADDRVALILVDYPRRQAQLKILGRLKVIERPEATEWIERLREPGYDAVIARLCDKR